MYCWWHIRRAFMSLKLIISKVLSGEPIPLNVMDIIDKYDFPSDVLDDFAKKYPRLTKRNIEIVSFAAKDYYKALANVLVTNNPNTLVVPSILVFNFLRLFEKSEKFAEFSNRAFRKVLRTSVISPFEGKDNMGKELSSDLFFLYKTLKAVNVPMNVVLNMPLIFGIDEFLKEKVGYIYDAQKISEQWKAHEKKMKDIADSSMKLENLSFMKSK